ncbi:hypothetical protein [Nocardia alni]|uniref:hypothetical protein n=1 Tax=Nocardia alni TaxID=2815723 RepID=UPI001C22C3B3|nr:hypothetical protein [Nocardia alni]
MSEIIWPERFTPGRTDYFVSNEIIASGLSAERVWPYLANVAAWPTYYDRVTDLGFPDDCRQLLPGLRFRFGMFGWPPMEVQVAEYEMPVSGLPGRLAWRAWQDGCPEEALDVYHAWLLEDLPGGRVRILTQVSQIGIPAAGFARMRPDPLLLGNQEWLDNLVRIAAAEMACA